MTPVGPDLFEESSGFPFIKRASVRLMTIVLEMSIIPPVDFGLCTSEMSVLLPSHYIARVYRRKDFIKSVMSA
jgi:hypothetical protein